MTNDTSNSDELGYPDGWEAQAAFSYAMEFVLWSQRSALLTVSMLKEMPSQYY